MKIIIKSQGKIGVINQVVMRNLLCEVCGIFRPKQSVHCQKRRFQCFRVGFSKNRTFKNPVYRILCVAKLPATLLKQKHEKRTKSDAKDVLFCNQKCSLFEKRSFFRNKS
jgi:hypothetical protein